MYFFFADDDEDVVIVVDDDVDDNDKYNTAVKSATVTQIALKCVTNCFKT